MNPITRGPTAGFFSAQIAGALLVLATIIGSMLVWQLQVRSTIERQSFVREIKLEEGRLRHVVGGLVRAKLQTNDPAIFGGLTTTALADYLTQDPRFQGMSGPTTPGFSLASITPAGTPGFFGSTTAFDVVSGGSPLDRFRQAQFVSSFSYTLSRRSSPASDATQLPTFSGSFRLTLREIPITSFALLAFENLDADSGIAFVGPALVLGNSVRSDASFTYRISPVVIPNAQIGATERVFEVPGLAASLMIPATGLTRPTEIGPEMQNLARKGQAIFFDGHSVYCDGTMPAGIAVSPYGGVGRLVISLGGLAQTNTLIDSAGANVATNRVSAYHVECTTQLACDRGVVIVGTTDARLRDIITTNGSVILSGSHTGGPLLVASSSGGVYFDNTGAATWNSYLVLPAPSPFVSATTAATIPAGARGITLAAGTANLTAIEKAYDSISLRVTPANSTAAFQAGIGSNVLPSPLILWVEGDATSLRIGVQTTGAAVLSMDIPRNAGTVEMTYSRSQNSVRLKNGASTTFVAISSLTPSRPRVECAQAIWSGSITGVDVLSSGAGTVLGGANAGQIQLRGLLSMGTVTRFGSTTFNFTPLGVYDPLESIVSRLIVGEF